LGTQSLESFPFVPGYHDFGAQISLEDAGRIVADAQEKGCNFMAIP
jgi:hypothetical protein